MRSARVRGVAALIAMTLAVQWWWPFHKHRRVIYAQTLPYQLTVGWDTETGQPPTLTYNCYLDGVRVVTGVTMTTCSFPVAALGQHTVGVTAVVPSDVPSESDPGTLTFMLQAPPKPTNVKVR